jgi:hypothetical protein
VVIRLPSSTVFLGLLSTEILTVAVAYRALFGGSQGNWLHSKHHLTALAWAQLAILHILFSLGTQPCSPLGHIPLVILGHFSQAIPQTPIFINNVLMTGFKSS